VSATVTAPRRPRLATGRVRLVPERTGYAVRVSTITGAALVLRVAFLGQLPLWRDEAFTGVVAGRSWTGMLDAVRHDSAPPLGYLVSHFGAAVAASPMGLRLTSALAGTAAVPLAAALGRRIGGDGAGLFAAAALAVAPDPVLVSRDARMGALAITLVMASALALWRAVEEPERGRFAVYFACVCLAAYTHYLALLAILAQLVAAAVVLRPARPVLVRTAAVAGAGALTLAPWLVAASAQFQHTETPFWLKSFAAPDVGQAFAVLLRGESLPTSVGPPRVLQAATVCIGALAGAAVLLLAARLAGRWRRGAAYLACASLGGVAVLLVASLRTPLVDARYFAVLWAPMTPLLGVGLSSLRPRALGVAALAVVGITTVAVMAAVTRPDWRATATWLDHHLEPSDQVILDSPDYLLLLYYANAQLSSASHVLRDHAAPWYWGTAAWPAGAVVPNVIDTNGTIYVFLGDFRRVRLPSGYQPQAAVCNGTLCVTPFVR